MAAAGKFFRSGNTVLGGRYFLLRKGCRHQVLLQNTSVLKELCRCLQSPISGARPRKTIDRDLDAKEKPVDLGTIDPCYHTEANLGQFYTVPEEVANKCVSSFLTKKYVAECRMAGSTNMMIRQPGIDVIQDIKGLPEDAQPPKFIFYGLDGCGKSLSLAHVIHYCYSAGWFILLVPSVFKWVHGTSELQISTFNTERFDQPVQSTAWLQLCRSINGKFFSQLKTSQEYKWGKRDCTKEGEPLGKIIDQGLQRANYATDAVGVILKEIKQNPSLRVLYAVNEFNGFFQKTSLTDTNKRYIKPNRLSLVNFFTELLDPVDGVKRGAMAFALSRTGMERSHIKSFAIPDLLGQDGITTVRDFTAVHVPPYSAEELQCCLRFYNKTGILTKELTPNLVREIAFLSNYEPRRVSAISMPY